MRCIVTRVIKLNGKPRWPFRRREERVVYVRGRGREMVRVHGEYIPVRRRKDKLYYDFHYTSVGGGSMVRDLKLRIRASSL